MHKDGDMTVHGWVGIALYPCGRCNSHSKLHKRIICKVGYLHSDKITGYVRLATDPCTYVQDNNVAILSYLSIYPTH